MTTASPDELVRASGYVRLLPRPQAATVIGHAIGGGAAVEFEVGRDGARHDDIRGDLACVFSVDATSDAPIVEARSCTRSLDASRTLIAESVGRSGRI